MNFYFEMNTDVATVLCDMHIKKSYFGLTLIVMFVYLLSNSSFLQKTPKPEIIPIQYAEASTTTTNNDLHYQFKTNGVLQEASSMDKSSSPYFWLNSGGTLNIANGVGGTNQGALSPLSFWRILYATNNSLDTDGGKYPQNLFRLVTKGSWNNVVESLRFKLTRLNMTDTPNRDGYSGVLLMSRYQDSMNLYYAGIRMDGTAVIKKKYKGVYYTLASTNVFTADAQYNKYINPNLIPGNVWMGLKTETHTEADGSVRVTLWIDKHDTGSWEQLLTVQDTAGTNGADVITGPAHTGIRTDYLDVLFDDYTVSEK